MILSYESLIKRWIKEKDFKNILSMHRMANQDVAHFIDRDIVSLLIDAEKTGCLKTLTAIIKCSPPRRLLEVKGEFETNDDSGTPELFGVDAPPETIDEDSTPHDLILFALNEYLNSENFVESMLKADHSKLLVNEQTRMI